MEDWLRNMGDWCISRKRYWGLPLPFWFCPDGHMNVVASREELRERATAGLEGLHELHRPWIDPVTIACAECGAEAVRVPEVGDCWLDAGIVPFSTLGYGRDTYEPEGFAAGAGVGLTKADLPDHAYWEKWFPADWISEMREQIRLWFYSQLFMSVALVGQAPYRRVLGYEKLHDEHGRAMHKSWGNAIWFDDAIEKIGADVSRWMFAGQDPGAEHELRLRPGQRRRPPPAHALEHVPLPRPQRQPGGLPPALGGGRPRARERQPARSLGDRARQRARPRLPRRARRLRHAEHDPGRRGLLGRPLELVRAPLATALLGGRSRRLRHPAPRARAVPAHHGPGDPVPGRRDVAEPGRERPVARMRRPRCTWPAIPSPTPARIAAGLLGPMADVRAIAELGHRARAEAKLRVRQPLASAVVAAAILRASRPALERPAGRDRERAQRQDRDHDDRPRQPRRAAGRAQLPRARPAPRSEGAGGARALAAGDYELGDDGVVRVAGEQLAPGEYELRSHAREGFEAQTDGTLVVAIDTRVTDELALEGTARDVVRFLQNVRKELGFDVSDRIAVRYAADERGAAVLEAHGASIAREVLAESFEPGDGGEHRFAAGGAEIAFEVARA